ncbi:isopenicillin N synthase family dioxygenase [Radicibacter daui]|uniref:isopenicillin N synthase family dioxygenase n=1 Tax=Radicibacter daui TaxID=3064829 RepID=UPI004046A06A
MADFPIIDLAALAGPEPARRELAAAVDAICRQTGFLAITGHGVPKPVIDEAWAAARAFFDLPLAEKQAVAPPRPGYPYGYFASEAESLAGSLGQETPPDRKESFNIGPLERPPGLTPGLESDFCYAPSLWPAAPAALRPALSAYYREMEALAGRLMRLFALALALPEDWFEPFIDRPISALRVLNYPESDVPPRPGQLRAGAHTDYGSLTILRADAAPGGLEIRAPSGAWEAVPPVEGGFIINIGDLMAQWTNDRWVSTLHRVVNPPQNAAGSARRQSIAFFHQPNWDAEITCLPGCLPLGELPRYPATLSGPHLMAKFGKTVQPGPAATS